MATASANEVEEGWRRTGIVVSGVHLADRLREGHDRKPCLTDTACIVLRAEDLSAVSHRGAKLPSAKSRRGGIDEHESRNRCRDSSRSGGSSLGNGSGSNGRVPGAFAGAPGTAAIARAESWNSSRRSSSNNQQIPHGHHNDWMEWKLACLVIKAD